MRRLLAFLDSILQVEPVVEEDVVVLILVMRVEIMVVEEVDHRLDVELLME